MNFYFALPVLLGASVIVQAHLNRQMGAQYGLATAVSLNAVVFLILSLGFFLIAKYTPTIVPEFLQVKSSTDSFKWSYIIPGICGFILVTGLPLSIQSLGPSTSFILLIASQIILSTGLEASTTGSLPGAMKLTGAVLVLVGSALVVFA